jgi:hypothetical protein
MAAAKACAAGRVAAPAPATSRRFTSGHSAVRSGLGADAGSQAAQGAASHRDPDLRAAGTGLDPGAAPLSRCVGQRSAAPRYGPAQSRARSRAVSGTEAWACRPRRRHAQAEPQDARRVQWHHGQAEVEIGRHGQLGTVPSCWSLPFCLGISPGRHALRGTLRSPVAGCFVCSGRHSPPRSHAPILRQATVFPRANSQAWISHRRCCRLSCAGRPEAAAYESAPAHREFVV